MATVQSLIDQALSSGGGGGRPAGPAAGQAQDGGGGGTWAKWPEWEEWLATGVGRASAASTTPAASASATTTPAAAPMGPREERDVSAEALAIGRGRTSSSGPPAEPHGSSSPPFRHSPGVPPPQGWSRADVDLALDRLTDLAILLDSRWRLGRTPIRVGVDSILGMVPVLGDAITTGVASFIVLQAARLGLPRESVSRLSMRVAKDFVFGSIPLLGSAIDAWYRANERNVDDILAHFGRPRLADIKRERAAAERERAAAEGERARAEGERAASMSGGGGGGGGAPGTPLLPASTSEAAGQTTQEAALGAGEVLEVATAGAAAEETERRSGLRQLFGVLDRTLSRMKGAAAAAPARR